MIVTFGIQNQFMILLITLRQIQYDQNLCPHQKNGCGHQHKLEKQVRVLYQMFILCQLSLPILNNNRLVSFNKGLKLKLDHRPVLSTPKYPGHTGVS